MASVYTTGAIDSLNKAMRKFMRNRCTLPNDKAALKGLLPAIREALKN